MTRISRSLRAINISNSTLYPGSRIAAKIFFHLRHHSYLVLSENLVAWIFLSSTSWRDKCTLAAEADRKIGGIRDIRDINQQSADKFVTFSMMRINLPFRTRDYQRPLFSPVFYFFSAFPSIARPLARARARVTREMKSIGDRAPSRLCNAVDCRNNGRLPSSVATEIRGNSALLSESRRFNQRPTENRWRGEREVVRCRDVRKIAHHHYHHQHRATTTSVTVTTSTTTITVASNPLDSYPRTPLVPHRVRGFSISFINP